MTYLCNFTAQGLGIYRIIYDLLRIMIFWSRVGWFANDFHEWRSHEWKLLLNHLMSDQNSTVLLWRHGNSYCDVILTYCPPIVSKLVSSVFPLSSSLLSLVNNRVRFHSLACKKLKLWSLSCCAGFISAYIKIYDDIYMIQKGWQS